jgi:hypothetical protein
MAKLRAGWTSKTASRRQRTKVANGSSLLPGVAGTSVWCRRMKEIMADSISDLGGMDCVSANEKNLIRRAATLTVEAERLEQRFALAEVANPEELDIYGRITGHLRRTLDAIGMKRRPRNVGGSFGDLMLDDIRTQRERAEHAVADPAAGNEGQP